MKVYNKDKTEILEKYDLEKGELKEDNIIIHHDEIIGQKESGHYEVTAKYPNGGKDVEYIIDKPYIEHQNAYDETQPIYVYIPYTEEEIKQKENEKKIKDLEEELAETDPIAIRYGEGYYTEEEYFPIREHREFLRDEINKLKNKPNESKQIHYNMDSDDQGDDKYSNNINFNESKSGSLIIMPVDSEDKDCTNVYHEFTPTNKYYYDHSIRKFARLYEVFISISDGRHIKNVNSTISTKAAEIGTGSSWSNGEILIPEIISNIIKMDLVYYDGDRYYPYDGKQGAISIRPWPDDYGSLISWSNLDITVQGTLYILGEYKHKLPEGYSAEEIDEIINEPREYSDSRMYFIGDYKSFDTPIYITVNTSGGQKTVDGTPLTNHNGSIRYTGKDPDLADIVDQLTLNITGSQTEVGSSKNTYTIDYDNIDHEMYGYLTEDDFEITERLGTLTVNSASSWGGNIPGPPTPDIPQP